jgi:hypothetical protein
MCNDMAVQDTKVFYGLSALGDQRRGLVATIATVLLLAVFWIYAHMQVSIYKTF